MAGYIGNKAVGLNVTTGDILGDVGVGGDLSLGDNDKAIFGAGSDLEIFHDGSNSFVKDTGTGGLVVATSRLHVNNAASNEEMISATQDGSVELFHNNVKKIETTSTGVAVTGAISASSGNITATDGNLVIGTADHGIQFAASTKNAGTSSVSNLMKDYEIGVWTPHLDNGGSITVGSAFYVRTGDLVHVQGFVTVTPTDNSSQFKIGGLPFLTLPGNNSYGSISISYWGNMDIASPNFITNQNSSDFMYLHRTDGNGDVYSNANILDLGSLRAFIFGGTYRTAQ